MKVLCPTDFSQASVAAARWAVQFVDSLGGGELQLLHCLNVVSRSALFIKMDVVFRERAEEDLRILQTELDKLSDRVQLGAYVVNSDPQSFVPQHAAKHHFDFIVMGTKGLTALKDMTVGSVTAYLMDRSAVPLFVIPETATFQNIQHLVLGVDSHQVKAETIAPLKKLMQASGAKLTVVHASLQDGLGIDYDPLLNLPLERTSYEFFTIDQGESIPASLTAFCQERGGDLLVMVHRRRAWFERLFNNSVVKSKLFQIEMPLLVLPE
ncbi:MAG: universal stress protein [Bacteroidetes bacterium]|nr:MAG: universal stress protein [Bacteroidota bacterium]